MKYFRPETLKDLFGYLPDIEGEPYTFLSGGTDLVPRYEQGVPLPANLVDLKKIAELRGIVEHENEVEIGALTTIEILKKSQVIRKYFNALALSTHDFAGTQIRHRATIGGNICNASPAGDTLPPLYAFNARLKVIGPNRERIVPISEFILAPGKTDLKPEEILQSIILPKKPYRSTFYKLGLRQAMAISVVNFAIVYDYDPGQQSFSYLDITAGAVAPTVVHLTSFMNAVKDDITSLDEVIDLVDIDISPISDIRGTAHYRRLVLKNVLKHVIKDIGGHE